MSKTGGGFLPGTLESCFRRNDKLEENLLSTASSVLEYWNDGKKIKNRSIIPGQQSFFDALLNQELISVSRMIKMANKVNKGNYVF